MAFAASSGTSPGSPAQAFISDVASHLGVSTQALENAVQQAGVDQVQQMVSSGKLTPMQASRIEAAVASGKPGAGLHLLTHGRTRIMVGGRVAIRAAVTCLGLTPKQLRTDLRSGQSLSAIASSTGGKTVQSLENAIVASLQQRLQQAQTDGRLTKSQVTHLESRLQTLAQLLLTRGGGTIWMSRPGLQSQTPTSN